MFLKSTQIQALILLLWQSMAVLVFSMPLDFSIAGYNPSSTNAEKLKLAQLFEQWMVKHEKTYAQPEDRLHGFENFMKNYKYMNQRKANGENGDHLVGLNNLADLSNDEFKEKYLSNKFGMGKRRERKIGLGNYYENESCNAPPSLNWKEKGVVTPVKDQGQCGSCWSFSSTGAIEGINAITTGELISLSEQELVECVTTNWGCDGGYMDYAFEWIIKNGGINTESNYPYTAKDGVCNITKANNKVVTIDGYEDVPPKDEALLCAVLKQPISVGIDAGARDFQLYTGGIYNGNCSSNPDDINHAVLLVGYGSENGTDYWIVKNSWSTKWGNQGYIYIKRVKSLPYGKCAILGLSSYPTKNHGYFSTISSF
ncbi:Cysteine protease [Rhynchospora pubera]|uniref:Cysteine protease n=1 Tax=Rhynchospora pubera TaxID=906938 RepID=A0AAV8G4E4_9POAL|nr:Cysteine protease [Rhynchospora pubera]